MGDVEPAAVVTSETKMEYVKLYFGSLSTRQLICCAVGISFNWLRVMVVCDFNGRTVQRMRMAKDNAHEPVDAYHAERLTMMKKPVRDKDCV